MVNTFGRNCINVKALHLKGDRALAITLLATRLTVQRMLVLRTCWFAPQASFVRSQRACSEQQTDSKELEMDNWEISKMR